MASNTEIPLETYQLLVNENWDEFGPIMVAYTYKRARDLYRLNSPDAILPGGYSIQDVVGHVITKAISYERKWYPEKVELRPWLINQIKSVLDEIYYSWESLHEVSFIEVESAEQPEVDSSYFVRPTDFSVASSLESARKLEEVIVEQEEKDLTREFIDILFDDINGDNELEEFMITILDLEDPSPRYVAEVMNRPVKEIYNLRLRLQRHAIKVQMKLERRNNAKAN